MKAAIFNTNGEKGKQIDLPKQFSEEIRPDLIKKAALVIQFSKKQPYGSAERAGKRHSATLSRRRRDFKGSYGKGISRVPRKTMLRRGTQFHWVGAVAPGTVGGRRAHPPKPSKILSIKINKKENRKAIRSAMAATLNKEFLQQKGMTALDNLPIIIDKLESITKTKDLKLLLEKLGLKNELARSKNKKIRAGVGKLRGRKYKIPRGPLLVISKESPITKACNFQGFEVSLVDSLNTDILAPGATPGRLVIWSLDSIDRLEKEKLFMIDKPKPKKEVKK
ncbi:MAG: 50S ribosomal protein L4 [Nanoarchaeota archaeon]|nr:50S ribosomal protein L4 [Nanoarchaeota archaeon]MBU2420019.1 50S ribosomal protein L4 [Nanoarchaeota archaeon]MBU2475501.1 50S ribosomal protein L4 [Nanoarchaeota archaeon]MBU3940534.1 50S ribosomal protein L4 [Nanoarchaeota archaeon]